MLIGFFNINHDTSEYTQGILSIGITMAMEMNEKTLIINCRDIGTSELEQSLFKDFENLKHRGIDTFLRESMVSMNIEENISNSAISLLNEKLDILIGTKKGSNDNLVNLSKILPKLNEIYTNVLINLDPLNHDLNKMIEKVIDVKVVNLAQSKKTISNALKGTSTNTFYLVNNYDSESMYSEKNIARILKVHENQIGIIPYDIKLNDSMSKGELVLYFLKSRLNQSDFKKVIVSSEKLQRRVIYDSKAI